MSHVICYLGAGPPRFYKAAGADLLPCDSPPASTIVAVVDVADETLSVTSLPLVRGSGDAGVLRRRRLEREFPGVALKALLPFRRRPAEGLVDAVLMAADGAGALATDLAALADTAVVRGVYTPAMLAAHWMRLANLADRKVLVLMPTPAGLRLMFMDQCCPLLSRLTPQLSPDKIAVEITRTIHYLHNTQRVARDGRVMLWFWGMDDATVSACLPTEDNFEVGAAPREPRLPDPESRGFNALLQLAASHPPSRQLAPHALRAGWYVQQVRRWGYGLAASLLLAGVAASGLLWSQARALRAGTAGVLASEQAHQTTRARLEESLAQHGLTVDEILTLPVAAAAVRQGEVSSREALELAARVFGSRHELALQSLEFQSGSSAAQRVAGGNCATEVAAGSASFEATFRFIDGLGVRTSADALEAVRTAITAGGRWHSSQSSAGLGELQPLTVNSGAGDSAAGTDWSACLARGDPA